MTMNVSVVNIWQAKEKKKENCWHWDHVIHSWCCKSHPSHADWQVITLIIHRTRYVTVEFKVRIRMRGGERLTTVSIKKALRVFAFSSMLRLFLENSLIGCSILFWCFLFLFYTDWVSSIVFPLVSTRLSLIPFKQSKTCVLESTAIF